MKITIEWVSSKLTIETDWCSFFIPSLGLLNCTGDFDTNCSSPSESIGYYIELKYASYETPL